ncbi:hypothetical protein IG389_00495 [Idiomarina abyssalis]|uniref:DUF5666 domain-containing protein n=1 Tax=Idiomarina abyssalis TaxID=86102 RepID=A0A8I1G9F1_9GAMM|nr:MULTISPECIES: DUF5666 domain-containing protein [Idiomarina]MBH95101.1 hypothetical protein [Idiomarina sp.]MBJ7267555.1 hypothetical protein [Idiomarina abyssalis]MBJ7272395.1 hypothetical protein [Idiomarina abyssalis]MBJ7314857.1 hypothetical protein [Idiomarina abyssalis]|tara:strand:- start:15907 stop:17661 length:1755 start_codon:yes stop_codon:yes gene_type:complete
MRFKQSLLVLAISGALTACGGSSSDSPNDNTSGGGNNTDDGTATTTTTVVSEGVITGFGSVYVNGQRYRSENAEIAVGNSPAADEAQLKVGMVVTVAASASDDGEDPDAQQIRYEEHLQGPVSFIDREAEQIEVLGQTILFDDLTEFDETDIETLSVGDFIEVSGYINDEGSFYATLVELETEETEIKLKGEIANLDTDAQTFSLAELTIDYSAAEYDDMTADDLADGLFVKVEGDDFDGDTLTLTASSIENKEENDIDNDAEEVTIAGIVKDYDSESGVFSVNRYQFTLNEDTEFDDGSLDTLANGVIVKVEGRFESEQLIAEEIEFKATDARSKTEGQVTDLNADNETFVIDNTTFSVTPETQYEDESGLDERSFTFDDIAVNDWLKVISRQDDQGTTIALKVKRIDQEDREGEVKGRVSDVSAEGMTIANVAVGFNENTEFEGEDDNISIERFIELVQSNPAVIVEVEGEYDGDTLIAAKVEVETVGGQDGDDDDDDNDDSTGKAEFEGEIESIEGDSVFVNGNELRFSQDTEFELNDEEVDLQTFYDALEVGVVVEIEGVWVDQSYIKVTEAELETNDEE